MEILTKEIVTDSLGCRKIANKMTQLINSTITFINSLQHYLKDYESPLRWSTAHPEKRNFISADWSRDDRLNHITDKSPKAMLTLT